MREGTLYCDEKLKAEILRAKLPFEPFFKKMRKLYQKFNPYSSKNNIMQPKNGLKKLAELMFETKTPPTKRNSKYLLFSPTKNEERDCKGIFALIKEFYNELIIRHIPTVPFYENLDVDVKKKKNFILSIFFIKLSNFNRSEGSIMRG